jgi:hypothetical protein
MHFANRASKPEQKMETQNVLPPGLAKLAGNRDMIRTDEFGQIISKSAQTLRKSVCENGHAYGLKPVKVGNRLLWSVKDIANLLGGANQ